MAMPIAIDSGPARCTSPAAYIAPRPAVARTDPPRYSGRLPGLLLLISMREKKRRLSEENALATPRPASGINR